MQRFKGFFRTNIFSKIKSIFKKSKGFENTAKHSLEKLGSLVKSRTKMGSGLPNLRWDQIFSTIFSPEARKKIHQGFIVSLIATATYGTGKIIALATSSQNIKTKASQSRPTKSKFQAKNLYQQEIDQIKKANLFNARESDSDKIARLRQEKVKIGDSEKCKSSQKKSSLPIKLVNTIVLQDSVKSIASVQIRSAREIITVRKGDKIKQMAKVSLINRRKVIIQNLSSGTCEHIENVDKTSRARPITVLPPKRGKQLISSMKKTGIKNEGNSFTIKKSFRDKMLENMSDLLSGARAVEIKNPDGTLSYQMNDVVPGSIYTQLNIQSGDIITSIDGAKIKNLNQVMNKFGNIKEIDHLELTIQRNGSEEKLDYNFEE